MTLLRWAHELIGSAVREIVIKRSHEVELKISSTKKLL